MASNPPPAEYHKGAPDISQGDQLPQGATQQVNQSVEKAAQLGEQVAQGSQEPQPQAAPEGQPEGGPPAEQGPPIDLVPPSQGGHDPEMPPGERDAALFGPDATQQGPLTQGMAGASQAPTPQMQAVYDASQDPTAPAAFKQMVQLLNHFYGG